MTKSQTENRVAQPEGENHCVRHGLYGRRREWVSLWSRSRMLVRLALPFSLAVLVALASLASAGPPGTWRKYRNNPVLDVGAPGEWDQTMVNSVTVTKDSDLFKMWYAGCTGIVCGIGHATSKNGIEWTKFPGNPVLPPTVGSWAYTLQNPHVMKDGDTYRMWFSANDLVSIKIGYAFSVDGVSWTMHTSPVLVGSSSSWDSASVSTPAAIREGASLTMWYSGHAGDYTYKTGRATSEDGIAWMKDASNPVFTPNFGWEDSRVHPMQILLSDGLYELYYYAGYSYVVIGHAVSVDGVAWTRAPDAPILSPGSEGSWDGASLGVCSVVQIGHKRMMWYSGSDGYVRRIGLARSNGYQ